MSTDITTSTSLLVHVRREISRLVLRNTWTKKKDERAERTFGDNEEGSLMNNAARRTFPVNSGP
jgi:uncharacterized protein YbaR (Trm112 family)